MTDNKRTTKAGARNSNVSQLFTKPGKANAASTPTKQTPRPQLELNKNTTGTLPAIAPLLASAPSIGASTTTISGTTANTSKRRANESFVPLQTTSSAPTEVSQVKSSVQTKIVNPSLFAAVAGDAHSSNAPSTVNEVPTSNDSDAVNPAEEAATASAMQAEFAGLGHTTDASNVPLNKSTFTKFRYDMAYESLNEFLNECCGLLTVIHLLFPDSPLYNRYYALVAQPQAPGVRENIVLQWYDLFKNQYLNLKNYAETLKLRVAEAAKNVNIKPAHETPPEWLLTLKAKLHTSLPEEFVALLDLTAWYPQLHIEDLETLVLHVILLTNHAQRYCRFREHNSSDFVIDLLETLMHSGNQALGDAELPDMDDSLAMTQYIGVFVTIVFEEFANPNFAMHKEPVKKLRDIINFFYSMMPENSSSEMLPNITLDDALTTVRKTTDGDEEDAQGLEQTLNGFQNLFGVTGSSTFDKVITTMDSVITMYESGDFTQEASEFERKRQEYERVREEKRAAAEQARVASLSQRERLADTVQWRRKRG